MKIGILFGGPSREREISFAGGRTVFDNLNKTLFEPIPIFIDSKGNFILIDWQYLYKGSIKDFYPPVSFLKETDFEYPIYMESIAQKGTDDSVLMAQEVGRIIRPDELSQFIDFAFLCLHGAMGEDGILQAMLEQLKIPYSGSGILASAIGINKGFQKKMMKASGWPTPAFFEINRLDWKEDNAPFFLQKAHSEIGQKIVIRPAHQGSSIGVSILKNPTTSEFLQAVNQAFFIKKIAADEWINLSSDAKKKWVKQSCDIRDHLGFPMRIHQKKISHPAALLQELDLHFSRSKEAVLLEAFDTEQTVIIEAFIEGKEFSCIVIEDEYGTAIALPPTEIVKGGEVFDYRSKYLAGLSRKITPIQIETAQIEKIRVACQNLFYFFGFSVYARIDGFIQADSTIYLNDPNTTSGMLPSSFFFHQAAEIGLNPSQFLSYIIRNSIAARLKNTYLQLDVEKKLEQLDAAIQNLKTEQSKKLNVAVVLGGYSSERHISVESGRNIYEKLASSKKYAPIPIFLSGNDSKFQLHEIPIAILLKDNADDIKDKISHFQTHEIITQIRKETKKITQKYAYDNAINAPQKINIDDLKNKVDIVFIALHGRPGEDGILQKLLAKVNLPFNGSGYESSQITINKFNTLQLLKKHGFKVAQQQLFYKSEFEINPNKTIENILSQFSFPLIAKPVDDGCSSAVKKIENQLELKAFLECIFRINTELSEENIKALQLKPKEEFPQKNEVLIEELITAQDAKYFLEITGGMLTHREEDNSIRYEIFEPSETLASGNVLSLEEKFLAGEGQNITPARMGNNKKEYQHIVQQIKQTFKHAAEILHIEGYCRIDAFVRIYADLKVETLIIEINSLPGMTPATCIFHQAAINHYKPYEFIDKILDYSYQQSIHAKH